MAAAPRYLVTRYNRRSRRAVLIRAHQVVEGPTVLRNSRALPTMKRRIVSDREVTAHADAPSA
jgi:hypothetical protein